jgi:acyl-homoserine lactone acylase PvdQ
MIRAADAEGVMRAAAVQGMFPQNLLIADATGSIIYLRGGRTPRRDPGLDASRALSGDDDRAQWRGIHPLRDLVTLRNPPTFYLQNNNATPSNMTAGPPLLKASDYPAYIWNDNEQQQFWDRAARVNEVLSAKPHFSVEDAMKLALDEKWVASESWTSLLKRAAAQPGAPHFTASSDEARVLERLLRFDGVAAKESVAALNFYFWRTAVVTRAGARLAALEEQIVGAKPATEDVMDILIRAVPDAVAQMRQRVGTVDRAYGDWFRIGRSPERHFPVGGGQSIDWSDMSWCQAHQRPAFTCSFTHRAFGFTGRTADGRPQVTYGSRALRLVVLGREFRSYSLHNFGQSDDPKSPHWDDQAEQLGSGHRLRRVPFTFGELADEMTGHLTIRVERN